MLSRETLILSNIKKGTPFQAKLSDLVKAYTFADGGFGKGRRMIQLLLVEDEAKTRNGLLNHIDWKNLGIDMLQTAQSAEEALELCEEYQPDIILSDIRMRKMNGLEMCFALREKYPHCKIIIISGYADKEYLKAAIELGSISYVEKPIDLEELEHAIKKTVKAVLEDRNSIRNNERLLQNQEFLKKETFLSLLRAHKADGPLELSELLLREYESYRVCVLRFSKPVLQTVLKKKEVLQRLKPEELSQAGGFLYGEFTDNRHMVLLLCGESLLISEKSEIVKRLEAVCEKPCGELSVFLALGDLVDTPCQIHSSYEHAREAEKAVFYKGYSHRESYCEKKEKKIVLNQEDMGSFKSFLIRGDQEAARRHIRELSKTLREMQAEASAYVLSIYFELEKLLIAEQERLSLESREKREEKYQVEIQAIEGMDTISEIEAHLVSQIEELFTMAQKDQSSSLMITRVMRYINEHYQQKNLSVKQIAAELYITPTYLSSLFKRKTGNTLGEYLTKVRMERSVQLLSDLRLKTYEVALAVGYEDPSYFAKVFKKEYGIAPSEYRERKLGAE